MASTAAPRQPDVALATVTGLSAGQHSVLVTGTGTRLVCGVAYWSIGRQAEGGVANPDMLVLETIGIHALQGAVKN